MSRGRVLWVLWLLSCSLIGSTAAAKGSPTGRAPLTSPAPATLSHVLGSDSSDVAGRKYSDTFLPLREDVRTFERDPNNRYTYCIRNVATYECPSYGSDGTLRRRQHKKTAYGTGFAYQVEGDETRLLTNEHVVSWPFVTDAEHPVDDVPTGCKLVTQKLAIVDNEDDEYEADDIPLRRVIEDRALDAAVLRAKGKLRLLPYHLGRSSALSIGDVVIVRGFPLGVFAAYNTGKVINTRDEDQYKHWDHADFIVDAQLSSGNSGSPVLALNRKSGEYELVGMFHASYTRASSLNAVIAIDQIRELMFTLKRSARSQAALANEPLATEQEMRIRMQGALADPHFVPYLSFGPLVVHLQAVGDRLMFEIFGKSFPLDDRRVAVLIDEPAEGGRGRLRQIWMGNDRGYRAYALSELDGESTTMLRRLLHRLYALGHATVSYRKLNSRSTESRDALQARSALQRGLSRTAAQDADTAAQLLELAGDKAPPTNEAAVSLPDMMSQVEQRPSLANAPVTNTKTETRAN